MKSIDFTPIDTLSDPQKIKSAEFDEEYIYFKQPSSSIDIPIIAKIEAVRSIIEWVDDGTPNVAYGFNCDNDEKANVFHVSKTDEWVLMNYTDENRIVHHEFIKISKLRDLLRRINNK